MFCVKCGKELAENSKFCTECGCVIDAEVGSIVFARQTQLTGAAVPISIYVDGKHVGNATVGSELTVPVAFGKHKVTLKFWFHEEHSEIEVTKEKPNKRAEIKIKMGLLISKAKIVEVIDL